ncbi:MAG TPA: zf-HC2 domain-containing protein, partial [Myxococcaceae bacterium]
MRCRRAEQWMMMALAGELSGRRPQRLAKHVEGCAGCRREWEAYAALDRVLGSLPLEASLPPRLEQVTLRSARLA